MTQVQAWLSAAHPFPLAAVLLLTALVGVASAGDELEGGRLAVAFGAMALSQLAIGWSNDYLDRETDAVHQPWKPVAAGRVDAHTMPPAIAGVLLGSLALGALLGLVPLLLLVGGTACGFLYNLSLKDTPLSALPFVIGLALLPPFVWTALDVYDDRFLWLYAFGTPLAFAAHLANTLPDIASDRTAGRKGLSVRLGRGPCIQAIGAALALAALIALLGPGMPVFDSAIGWWSFFAYLALAAAAGLLYTSEAARGREVWGFRVVAAAGVVLAGGWLAAV